MSIKIIDMVMDMPFKPHHKLVMIIFADYANDKGGNIFPSLLTISRRTSLSRPTVVKIISELDGDNFIKIEKRGGVDRSSNHYRIEAQTIHDWLTGLTSKEIELVKSVNHRLVKNGAMTSKASLPDPSLPNNIDPLNDSPAVFSTRAIQTAYENCVPYKVDWVKGEGHAAKWLADNGYTPDDVTRCYTDLKAGWWADKPLSLTNLKKQIGEWKTRKPKGKGIKLINVVTA